ncbi:helix-turn-helix transcriptional regulator [Pseudorhodoferax sp. Leaf267]|uniref:ArsR/SmtB family transcription factor n=1 Tax=Pseudorhodoferax sp. Leaf267 TaxID=1736316 RepID=UPI0006FEA618|nr:helix-turn-helix domain-containing protein [Pseudorhodoferax sp. Leaf267]KQP23539.1 ArsR family transcriptional regulator [Pseudorhodoferax sp. Leaf267]
MEEVDAVRSLAALAQALRLRLFRALVVAGPQGLTPGTLASQLAVAGNTLSFHLKELTHAGLVTQERQGRSLIYRASFSTMDELLAYLTENCCEGAACATTDAAAGRCKPHSLGHR